MKKFGLLCVVVCLTAFAAGCNTDMRNVPPQCVGRILTPTGWENKLYSPGQVDIGQLDMHKRGNSLVLIQMSAFAIKEQFLGAQATEDKEDHRVFTADKTPVTLDVRFMFTSPDAINDAESVKRFFTLGNPAPAQGDERVMHITLDSIYKEQAQLQVRGKIRDIMGKFNNFDDAFMHRDELNSQIRKIVSGVLEERKVPLVLVDCQVSNIKPDPLVWENQVKIQAADAEIQAMKKLQSYLDENPTARLIFVLGKLKEIAQIASEKGNNTIIISTVEGAGISADKLPLPLPSKAPAPKKAESESAK
jgi:regulator of protease activity HflC (stomatin/prohibitin superfamily)